MNEDFAGRAYSPLDYFSITADHIRIVESLPFIHRDHFDRMIIATAMADGMTILRGYEYFCNGAVSGLKKVNDVLTAIVEGTIDYRKK